MNKTPSPPWGGTAFRREMAADSRFSRRDLLALLAAATLSNGCGRRPLDKSLIGEIVGPNVGAGHRLRDEPPPMPAEDAWLDIGAVIVGGGVAGLAAARELRRQGYDDFLLCELEPRLGGTSTSGQSSLTRYPWGAHYLPLPQATNEPLVELLREMGVVVGTDDDGEPIAAEEYLCRVPQERLFRDGAWQAELDPLVDGSADERAQAAAFEAEIDRWVAWRDAAGRRAFSLPIATASDDEALRQLDRQSMSEWLDERKLHSPKLRWTIEYACRDDYGATLDQTSAWAGLFYAASRKRRPGGPSQPLLTWPEGNGRLVRHLAEAAADRVLLKTLVWRIEPMSRDQTGSSTDGVGPCRVIARDGESGQARGWRARRVLFAAPQFVARRVIAGYGDERGSLIDQFQYGSWLVANLHLRERPVEPGVPPAWDNVLFDSPSLGYVSATHQTGSDYGATVWTYYLPFCGLDPREERQRLFDLTWEQAAELVLSDLETAHPDLRSLVTRLDVMRWGHAMIRPSPGFITGNARRECAQPWRGVHFAHTELSGVALFEEAFAHGIRAAEEVLREL